MNKPGRPSPRLTLCNRLMHRALHALLGAMLALSIPAYAGTRVTVVASDQGDIRRNTQMIQILCAAAGLTCEIELLPWRRALARAHEGHALIYGVSQAADTLRNTGMQLSTPVYKALDIVIEFDGTSSASPRPGTLDGRTLCASQGMPDSALTRLGKATHAAITTYPYDADSALRMLMAQRCDGVLIEDIPSTDVDNLLQLYNARFKPNRRFVLSDAYQRAVTIHFAASASGPLVSALNELDKVIPGNARQIAQILAHTGVEHP